MKMIDKTKSLNEVYMECLKLKRDIELKEFARTSWCINCKKRKSEHLGDERCSTYALSSHFKSEFSEQQQVIEKSLLLLEELFDLPIMLK